MAWKIREYSRNVHRIDVELAGAGSDRYFLLVSDAHWDSPHCDRALLKRHLDQALERDALVLDCGDWFDVMQGKFDKRSDKSELRPELLRGPYLDECVAQSAEWLRPYISILGVRGQGNHETAVLKRHEFNLTQSLVDRLRAMGAPRVHMGGYAGWIHLHCTIGHTRRFPFRLHYFHGAGGGGPVTRDVIKTNRQAVYLTNADIVWTGHTHDAWSLAIARVELTSSMTVRHREQVHVKTPGYKQEYGDGYGGWAVERGLPPKPLGAYWLRVFAAGTHEVQFELTRAK